MEANPLAPTMADSALCLVVASFTFSFSVLMSLLWIQFHFDFFDLSNYSVKFLSCISELSDLIEMKYWFIIINGSKYCNNAMMGKKNLLLLAYTWILWNHNGKSLMHVKAEHSVLKALEYWFTYVKTVKVIIGHCVFRQFYILTGQINFNILVYAFSLKLQVYQA